MSGLSLVGKLFGWTGAPAWLAEIVVMLVVSGVATGGVALWWHHHKDEWIQEGMHRQQTADDAARVELKRKTDADTAALAARVAAAEKERDQAAKDSDDYRRTHPLSVADLKLCNPAATAHGGGGGVHQAAGDHGPGPGGAPAQGVGKPVPAPDSPSPDDRLRLLDALGALLDHVDGQVGVLQTRLGITPEKPK